MVFKSALSSIHKFFSLATFDFRVETASAISSAVVVRNPHDERICWRDHCKQNIVFINVFWTFSKKNLGAECQKKILTSVSKYAKFMIEGPHLESVGRVGFGGQP